MFLFYRNISEQKDSSYHDIQAKFSNYLGTGLDILGAGLDAHDLGENLVKLWDNEGNPNIANWQRAMVNVGKVSQNVYGLTAETASLMGTFVPKGVIASSKYAQFFKNASVLNRTNFILLTLQLNSVAYSYFRDQEIDKILLYAGKEYQSKLSMRNLILDQLFKAYENDENVTKGEIGRILAHYPIFRPYSKAFLENFIVEKHFYALFNSTYLEKLFGVSDESSLTGFQRIVLALNALAHISAYEDDDYERRLNKMIDAFPDDNWLAGVENAIAGAFKGDDAYKIFNTEDFKRKTIPSYIVKNSSKMTAGTFYEMMYYNTFVGDIGTEAMKELEEIGKVVKNIKEKDIKYEEEPLNPSTLLLTLPNNATLNNNTLKAPKGEIISFQGGITASEVRWCVQQGGDGGTYELWYTDVVDGKRKSVPLDFDRLNNTFSFVMPSSEIVLIELHYNNNIDDEFEHRDGFCGLPDVLESIDNNTSTEENNNTNNQTVNLTNGLVAHYEFEGNANDSSGNGNNGTEHGGVSYVDGVIGKAGRFDGVDDYVEIKNDDTLNINKEITLCSWVNLNRLVGKQDQDIIINKDGDYDIAYELGIHDEPESNIYDSIPKYNLAIFLGNNGLPNHQSGWTDGRIKIIQNKWKFICVTYNMEVVQIYENANLLKQYYTNGYINTNNGTVRIGARGNGKEVGSYFDGKIDDLRIYNRALNESEIKELYKLGGGTTPITTTKTINLLNETHQDGTFIKKPFTKQWTFNKDLTDLNITILENSYQNTITSSDLIKDGKTLKVNLTPNSNSAINKLVLQFKNSNGEIVKVSGSKTFWSLTKTNHKPRLADGQITRLVGVGSSYLDIETYDSDGDSVTLSVEESAGGSVSLNGNRLSASFSDGKVAHTIKIGLDDGKERVVEPFTVIDFSQNSIENFYSDVDTNSSYFKAIAFATLKGVVGGQIDPNDETKRVFRPDDEVSLAEALKMVINAEKKAGLIELTTADAYMEAYPKWAMKYYTFAREKGALDRERSNLATLYPTREMIAKLIVKTLDLDSKIKPFGELHFAFSDEDTFSDAQLRHYGEIAHIFGLFMLDDQARAKESVSRAELVDVIRKIFMIPKGELVVNPVSVEKGEENITATLSNVVAQNINSSYELYDSSADVSIALTSNTQRLSNPIDSTLLPIGENIIYGFMSNHGVRGVALATVKVNFVDSDNDGIQDREDSWLDDIRYAYDSNGNGIPDILDTIYNLWDYTATDSVEINGEHVAIEEIVRDGGVAQSTGGTVQVIELNVSTNTIVMNNLEEYNLSLSIGDTQQQNLDVLFELNDASLATLTPSWNYEVIDWETYSENNLTLIIKAKAVGESNLTIRVKDEDNREVTKTINLSVLEKNANTIIDIRQPNWTIYGDTTNATVTNVYDSEKEREVIKLTGNGKKTSFRIGNRAGRASYVGAWHNKTEKILKWSMKYDEPFRIYIPITTKHGNHYLTYTNQSIDTKGKIRGGKVSYGLGEDSTDGTWHTFTRDLEADWNAFMPNDPFVAVNGFFISGSGRVVELSLKK